MMKFIYTFFCAFSLSVMMPETALASEPLEISESQSQPKLILQKEYTLRVIDAEGETLRIYDVAGVVVATIVIDSPDKTLNLSLQKGCYIAKVGKTVRKIYLR